MVVKAAPMKAFMTHSAQITALGLVLILGRQMNGWNSGLSAGLGFYMIAQILVSVAYIFYTLCTSEVASAIAFEGGCYGLSRIVFSFYGGFVMGMLEALQYLLMATSALSTISSIVVIILDIDRSYKPVVWFIYLILSLVASLYPRGISICSISCVIVSLLLIAIYILGSTPNVSINENGPYYTFDTISLDKTDVRVWFVGNGLEFFGCFMYATFPYFGIEAVTLFTNLCKKPKEQITYGILKTVIILFVINIFLIFIASSLPNGLVFTASLEYYMTIGFHLSLGISERMALLLILPSQFGIAWIIMIPFSKVIMAMAESKMLPMHFRSKNGHYDIPYIAIGNTFCFIICLIGYFSIPETFEITILKVAVLCSMITNIGRLIIYINFRTKFSSVTRAFKSALGIPGAIIPAAIFGLCFLSTAFFQSDGYIALILLSIYFGVITIFYFYYTKTKQVMSTHEQIELFRLQVIFFNIRKNKKESNDIFSRFSRMLTKKLVKLGIGKQISKKGVSKQKSGEELSRIKSDAEGTQMNSVTDRGCVSSFVLYVDRSILRRSKYAAPTVSVGGKSNGNSGGGGGNRNSSNNNSDSNKDSNNRDSNKDSDYFDKENASSLNMTLKKLSPNAMLLLRANFTTPKVQPIDGLTDIGDVHDQEGTVDCSYTAVRNVRDEEEVHQFDDVQEFQNETSDKEDVRGNVTGGVRAGAGNGNGVAVLVDGGGDVSPTGGGGGIRQSSVGRSGSSSTPSSKTLMAGIPWSGSKAFPLEVTSIEEKRPEETYEVVKFQEVLEFVQPSPKLTSTVIPQIGNLKSTEELINVPMIANSNCNINIDDDDVVQFDDVQDFSDT